MMILLPKVAHGHGIALEALPLDGFLTIHPGIGDLPEGLPASTSEMWTSTAGMDTAFSASRMATLVWV